ncbi:MAG: PQQ-binding-like beta-propeller repeat protein [Verrucomicrobia bacterium]|nr:PQQ-binding-like beta-propeller repeat protein [Verrucomicrobiota bacterium]
MTSIKSRVRSFRLHFVSVALAIGVSSAKADWTDFRGPHGDGNVSASGDTKLIGFPLNWSETNNIKWKTEIPFRGWSTPIVQGGQVWVTTATEQGNDYFAICLDKENGKILFNEKVFHTDNPEPLGNGASMNSYATPSAAIEPGRVYVHFGSAGTACLDTKTAKVIWKRTDLPCRHYRGPSASPVLFENLLIVTFDGADLQYTAGLDKQTGATIWKTNRSVAWNDENAPDAMTREGDHRKSHGTPLLATVAGKPQLISVGAKASYGYDPRNGHELWRVEYNDWSSAPRPLFEKDIAYVVTGLTKRELLAIKADGHGNVTDTHVVWKLSNRIGKYASPLLVDGLIYTASDESFVTCIDTATGQVVWSERIGGKYAGSPIYADGRLYFFSQDGTTTVLKPGRTFQVLTSNKLDAGFMASPAADGKALFLRTKTHLYRVEASTAATR